MSLILFFSSLFFCRMMMNEICNGIFWIGIFLQIHPIFRRQLSLRQGVLKIGHFISKLQATSNRVELQKNIKGNQTSLDTRPFLPCRSRSPPAPWCCWGDTLAPCSPRRAPPWTRSTCPAPQTSPTPPSPGRRTPCWFEAAATS